MIRVPRVPGIGSLTAMSRVIKDKHVRVVPIQRPRRIVDVRQDSLILEAEAMPAVRENNKQIALK